MSDIDSGASAPAESSGVPIDNPAPRSEPLGTQTPVAEKPVEAVKPEPKADAKPEAKPEPSKSAGEAVRKAFADIDAKKGADAKPLKDAAPVKDAKVEAKPEQPRENGKFASAEPKPEAKPAEQSNADPAPKRFRPEVQAKWAGVDPEVRTEVTRMERELTEGIEKHRRELEPIKPYADMARQAGTTVEAALKSYTELDKLLHTDKLKGLEAIFERVGISPREYAAHILNQSPDQQASQSDATIRELKQTVARLEQQVGGVTQTFQAQREQATHADVAKFAADNPRFDELAGDIAFFLQSGKTQDLAEAYKLAERLNPAPASPITIPVASSAPATPDLTEQIRKGSKSLNGAPAPGSDPNVRPTAKSPRQALERAFARVSA